MQWYTIGSQLIDHLAFAWSEYSAVKKKNHSNVKSFFLILYLNVIENFFFTSLQSRVFPLITSKLSSYYVWWIRVIHKLYFLICFFNLLYKPKIFFSYTIIWQIMEHNVISEQILLWPKCMIILKQSYHFSKFNSIHNRKPGVVNYFCNVKYIDKLSMSKLKDNICL